MRNLFKSEHFFPLLLLVAIGLLAGRGLIGAGYFNMHDDLQMMRLLQLEKCFLDLQIPCRWVPDMGYGFGFPLFNYYPPLPYLIGEMMRIIGFSFVDAIKAVFVLAFVTSGITIYALTKEFFGRLGGVVSGVFYIWAPYHAVDIYVRGAMNEAWALVWFPAILWTSYRLFKTKKHFRWTIALALSWFALLVSHNLMVMIFVPFFAIWSIIWIVRLKSWSKIPYLLISGLLSFGLAAFFTLPAFVEKGLVQVDSLVVGYYDYSAHFATINQLLLSRFWGYGPSVWLEEDVMSFQVGQVHWILSLIVVGFALLKVLRKRKIENWMLVVGFFLALGWFTAFMAHSRSTPIWQVVPMIKFVQFPWRFVTLVILAFSAIAGAVTVLLPRKWKVLVSIVLMVGVVAWSWEFFKPEYGKLGPLTDEEKFSDRAWQLQQTAGIYDYLPNTAEMAPQSARGEIGEIMEGKGLVFEDDNSAGTNWVTFWVDIKSDHAKVRINVLDFPEWRVKVDEKEVDHYIDSEEKWGRMYIDLDKGEHFVYARLHNTPVRDVANTISVVSWIGLFSLPLIKRRIAKKTKAAAGRSPSS